MDDQTQPNDTSDFTLRAHLRRQNKLLETHREALQTLQADAGASAGRLAQAQRQVEMLSKQLGALETRYAQENAALARLESLRDRLPGLTGSPEGESTPSITLMDATNYLIGQLEHVQHKEAELDDAKVYIASLEQAAAGKDVEIRHQQAVNADLAGQLTFIHGSLAFRAVVKPVWRLRRAILPDHSRRARLYFSARTRLRRLLRPGTIQAAANNQSPEAPPPQPSSTAPLAAVMPKYAAVEPHPLKIEPGATVVFTIVSKNYLSYARVLMHSLRSLHPELTLVTVLVDEIDGYFDPKTEPFQTLLAADLGIPNWRHFALKYDIMELNTAVKPYAIRCLMEKYAALRVIYFDPDILVESRIDRLFELLDHNLCVLTPHITAPLNDTYLPSELDFLRVGTYNLGFFAISRNGDWEGLIGWWEQRLYEACTREVDRGLFVDQHWMDLAPSLFAPIHVLRDPGYNVAYWNLSSRSLDADSDGKYTVNGQPLVFFHFSGFSVARPEIVSRHQNRFNFDKLSETFRRYFSAYRQRLIECGYEETSQYPYAWGAFSDGLPVTDVLRVCLRSSDSTGEIWPDAFTLDKPNSFRNWAVMPGAIPPFKYLSPYALAVYQLRYDLQVMFPDISGADEQRFAEWFVEQTEPVDVYFPAYREPVRQALRDADFGAGIFAPLNPAKKNGRQFRLLSALRYFRDYPIKVKPYLPPHVLTEPAVVFAGPANFYGRVRNTLDRFGVLRPVRRVVGPRLVLTARHYFTPPQDALPAVTERQTTPYRLPKLSEANGAASAAEGMEYGATVVGYLRAETGVGQVARNLLKCLNAAQFPVSGRSLDTGYLYRESDDSAGELSGEGDRFVNIFNVNADQAVKTYHTLGRLHYAHHYNIGYWFWELSQFPADWDSAFELYDEIWTATRFVQEAIQARTSKPVHRMPVSIEVPLPEGSSRAQVGLPEDSFIVLFNFDALSVVERKNPWAVIRAFETAFTAQERRSKARLVMKVANLNHVTEQARLRSELQRVNAILIDKYLDRPQVNALTNHCDAYISLHRSEGYGLTLAEAMVLGKPVVATAYSGNMDFMSDETSYLIPYRLVELGRPYAPYSAHAVWAEPDVTAAADALRQIYDHREAAREKGMSAAHFMREQFNSRRVGEEVAGRLSGILASYGYLP